MAIRPPVALIAGPTASGKSELALALAERTGGVIVNADSAQIYRDLPVLSAAPTEAERARAEHRLYGVLDGATACSAAGWAKMGRREIDDIHASGRLPILAGGTGLYIRTLFDGIAPVPEIDAAVRDQVRNTGVEENRAKLKQLDPAAAERLGPADSTRIGRALEVVMSTGRPLADWHARREGGIADRVDLKPVILLPPRAWLHARCDERFQRMMDSGAVEEVAALLARDLSPALPVMRAIGVREIAAMLDGEIDRERAIELGVQSTRRYAKRQYTWFAHQPPAGWPRFSDPLDRNTTAEALALFGLNA